MDARLKRHRLGFGALCILFFPQNKDAHISQKKFKATRRSISILQQVVTGYLPGWKISFIDGKWRDMVFITNNFAWSAATIAALYKARWEVELLTHLMLRFLKFKAKANCSYTRFVGFVRAVVWLKKDLMSVLRAYGIAPGGNQGDTLSRMPYLLVFESYFNKAIG